MNSRSTEWNKLPETEKFYIREHLGIAKDAVLSRDGDHNAAHMISLPLEKKKENLRLEDGDHSPDEMNCQNPAGRSFPSVATGRAFLSLAPDHNPP